MSENKTKRAYYRPTTADQRQLLFQTWIETGNLPLACRVARMSRQAFYYWKPRFDQQGWAGLKETRSHAPHQPVKIDLPLVEKVIAIKQAHPPWGRHRIALELRKENNWVPLVSPSTVRRLLITHGVIRPMPATSVKKKKRSFAMQSVRVKP